MLIDLIKENSFTHKKSRMGRYPAETKVVADYADDLVLLANTLTQAKFLLYSLEISYLVGGIGFHMNTDIIVHVF